MTRDIVDRLTLFAGGIKVDRLALNWEQVERYAPPPNPARMTDTRAEAYVAKYGLSSWELDALDPTTIATVIETAVGRFRDSDLWSETVTKEKEGLRLLEAAVDRWEDVADFLSQD